MKKLFALCTMLIFCVGLLAGCGGSQQASSGSGSGSGDFHGALKGVALTVGTSGTYAPFSYFKEDGTTLTGYDLALMAKLQEILGFEMKDGGFKDMDYPPLVTSISQGQLDVVAAALCATEDRKKNIDFSDPYYDVGVSCIVGENNNEIKSLDDLKSGKYKIAVQTGCDAYEYATHNLPAECLVSFDSQALAYKAVEEGQVDATVYDRPGTAYGIKTGKIHLKIVGEDAPQAPYTIAFSKNIVKKYPNIVKQFNAALKELKDNGTLDQLKKEYIGE